MASIDPLVKKLLQATAENNATASSELSRKRPKKSRAEVEVGNSSTPARTKRERVDWYVQNMLLATDRKDRKDEIRRQDAMEKVLERSRRKFLKKETKDERYPRTFQKRQHRAKRSREREAQFSKLASAVSKLKKKREDKP